jgi:uncharacterized protein
MTAKTWIKKLGLRRHPEGGWYRETYRSAESLQADALPDRFKGARSVSTAIYFLLERGQMSRLHRIQSDEVWHHYAGGSLVVHSLTPDGRHTRTRLGSRVARGERPQAVVPAGSWFGAMLAPDTTYALVGCTVAPGFDFADFELGNAQTLLRLFPRHGAIVRALCRDRA